MIGKILIPKIKIPSYYEEPTIPANSEIKEYTLSPEELAEIHAKYGAPKEKKQNRILARPKEFKKCCIEGCEEKSRTKNMCSKHYTRFRFYGDPLFLKRQAH